MSISPACMEGTCSKGGRRRWRRWGCISCTRGCLRKAGQKACHATVEAASVWQHLEKVKNLHQKTGASCFSNAARQVCTG